MKRKILLVAAITAILLLVYGFWLIMFGVDNSHYCFDPANAAEQPVVKQHANAAKLPDNTPDISGLWGTKYGEMLISQRGHEIIGTLVKTSNYCPFKNGEVILDATVLEDSLSGKFKMCQADDDCGDPVWAFAMMLIANDASLLTGSAYSKEAMCPLVGFSKSANGDRGLYFKQLNSYKNKQLSKNNTKPSDKNLWNKKETDNTDSKNTNKQEIAAYPLLPGPPAAPGTYDPRAAVKVSDTATKLLLSARRLLSQGKFELARAKCMEVTKNDPGNPNALVGIGISYWGRNNYEKALEYYKLALASDPNYGMAYYNMACIYALQNKPEMAIRYLQIAFVNGFIILEEMSKDPDLASLRNLPEYKKLIGGELKK